MIMSVLRSLSVLIAAILWSARHVPSSQGRLSLQAFPLEISKVVYLSIGFGGLGVACWPLVPKFAGSNPAEAVGFLGRKNPQHAFLRRGSKAHVVDLRHVKDP